jgi:hypothetical protein
MAQDNFRITIDQWEAGRAVARGPKGKRNPGFRYTEEQWARVARELPAGAHHQKVRQSLEEWVGDYIGLVPSNPKVARKQFIQQCKDVSRNARKLFGSLHGLHGSACYSGRLGAFYAAGLIADKPQPLDLFVILDALPIIARFAENLQSNLLRRGRAPCFFRDQLIFRFMVDWLHAGGKLRASGAQNGAKNGGPLVRFVLAASKPANVQPALTVDSARSLVRKDRARALGTFADQCVYGRPALGRMRSVVEGGDNSRN